MPNFTVLNAPCPSLQVAGMILDGQQLKFYQWDGDVSTLLDNVRNKINVLAESWTPEQKTHCLRETEDTFKVWNDCLYGTFEQSCAERRV